MATYEEKVKQWNKFVQEHKIPQNYAGFPTVLFMKFGKDPSPLIFWSLGRITLLLGINYALMWGILMHLMSWRRTEIPVLYQIVSALLAGLFFGLFMALLYKRHFRKHHLISWNAFSA